MFGLRLGKLGAAIKAGTGSAGVVPLFSRDYEAAGSLGADATFTRASTATVTDFEGLIKTVKSGEARFNGLRRVENLFTDITTSLASGSATTAVSVAVGTYVFSMGAGSGTATFSGTATGSTGTLDADGSSRTAKTLTITGAGTIIVTASVAALATIMLENVTGQANQNPSEYVSAGVATGPELISTGDFSSSDGWVLDAGQVAINAGQMTITNAGDGTQVYTAYYPLSNLPLGVYEVTVDIDTNVGSGVNFGLYGNGVSYSGVSRFGWVYEGVLGVLRRTVVNDGRNSFAVQAEAAEQNIILNSVSLKRCDHGANVDGIKYFATENGNSVVSNVVTEGTGAAITGGYLLMEPAATNQQIHTNNFASDSLVAAGTGSATPIRTIAYADGPLGALSATRFQFNRGTDDTGYSLAYRLTSGFSSGTNYVASIWMKSLSGSVTIGVWATGQQFETVNGGNAGLSVHSVGEEWVRINSNGASTGTAGSGGSVGFGLLGSHIIGGHSQTADVIVCARMIEPGTTPTSYIPTSDSAVTRAAETLSYSGAWTADNETRAITDAGTVDTDDWDGIVDATINGADNLAQITSIDVYTTGERPA